MEFNLGEITLFSGLDREQLNRIERLGRLNEYQRGDILFLEGDEPDLFYMVLSGEVKISRVSPGGREKILKMMGRGDIFGEMSFIEGKSRSASAEVSSEKARLFTLEGEMLLKLIRENPEIAFQIIITLSDRLRRANHEIENLAFLDVEGRLKDLLFRLARTVQGKRIIDRRITHEEIAQFIGTSRETVTRVLNRMQDRGMLEIHDSVIYLRQTEKW